MQLVKRLRVWKMCSQDPQSCTLILGSVDPGAHEEGSHYITSTAADSFGISLGLDLNGCELEYTFTHRMLIGERNPMTEPRQSTDVTEYVMYWRECISQGLAAVLLREVQRRETWGWHPSAGYCPGEPLGYSIRHTLKLATWHDAEDHPPSSFELGLTPEEYDECTKLLPGSVFDLTLQLISTT